MNKRVYDMSKSENKFQLAHDKRYNNSKKPIIIYRITDYTTNEEYARQMQNKGYKLTAMLFK